tara:strand:+ start:9306 stop:11003 length:1698 start_codon:yes stop_codon:yes gene_type:complete
MPPSPPRHVSSTLLLATLISLCSLGACSDEDGKSGFDPDKLDVGADQIEQIGRLSFGGDVTSEFVADDQLDGYVFTAEAGALVTIENTNLGTSRNLDSTLVVYGPADESGSYAGRALAADDDGGWGLHAKIKEFKVPSRGDYLVVISTYAGADRGRYRLALSCEGESCVIPCDESCGHEDTCSGQTCDAVDGCLSQDVAPVCSDISVSAQELVTTAQGESDRFVVRLKKIPEEHVVVHLESSDIDQAAVYPLKINFCAPGYTEELNGCELIDPETGTEVESWSREVEVTVTGTRSLQSDGDVPFSVSMTVVTEDEHYAGIELQSIAGTNVGDAPVSDLSELSELRDGALLAALHELTNDHLGYGYRGQNNARNIMFSAVDAYDGLVEGLYTGSTIERPLDSTVAFQRGFNSEHTWPQSQFDEVEPARSDLHHVFPTVIETNGVRSSFDYGITSPTATGSLLGSNADGPGTVYQVRPKRRGDVARAHFYLVARYGNDTSLGIDFDDDNNGSNGRIKDSEEAVLRAWHIQDPVDDLERTRNNRVEAFQGNRNPFIDRPELVNQVADF